MTLPLKSGRVDLVGAGPGSLGLVTLRAKELIQQADVLVYDYLCNPRLLHWVRADAEKIYAGKSASAHTLTQDEINALLVEKAHAGKHVVRLKGGDPYVFGRGGEEAQVLLRAGIPFEVVPGITSAIAAPSYAGIPVTHRDLASTVTFVTGHEDPTKTDSSIDWTHLARLRGTKVFLMGVERLQLIADRLQAEGADPQTPVALVRWGTTARQESVTGTLASIAEIVTSRGFKAPAVTVIGDVVTLRDELNWYEKLPLLGRRVVVTRTRRQSSALVEKLSQLGADVLEIPTIRITPVELKESQLARIPHLSAHYDWLVFTSPNAVDYFFETFFQKTNDVRDLGAIRIAAIGPATARKLHKLHLRVDLQPSIYTVAELASAFPAGTVAQKRFCFPHGNLAEPFLSAHLREKGGEVDEWILYQTNPETGDLTGARARYLQEGAHAITFTSASTADCWHALKLQPVAGAPRPKVISMGPVTTDELKFQGVEVDLQSEEATIDSLVKSVQLALI